MAKILFDAINDIREMVRSSTAGQADPWLEIFKQCKPPGMMDASYCEPVEDAVGKYILGISDEDKRSIWLGTEIGQMEQDEVEDIYIPSIEMDLSVLLLEEVNHYMLVFKNFYKHLNQLQWASCRVQRYYPDQEDF